MLNDQIVAYLNLKGIAWGLADFQTVTPPGDVDQIVFWDEKKLGPQPTTEELAGAAQWADEEATKANNKKQAMAALQATDWTEMPSVSDPSITPHLTNKADFVAYRAALRAIAVTPPAVSVILPDAPTEQWG